MGHADPPPRSDHDSWSWRRQKNTALGRIEIRIRSNNGGANYAQFRSSQPRWRRRGALVEACDRAAGRTHETLISTSGERTRLPKVTCDTSRTICTDSQADDN